MSRFPLGREAEKRMTAPGQKKAPPEEGASKKQ
jgi:hypothetical protein